MLKLAKSIRDIFIVYLIIGTFFYAMHSCEYTKTNRELCTTIITIDYISFFKQVNNQIHSAKFRNKTTISIKITFKIQKNMEAEESVSNYATNS